MRTVLPVAASWAHDVSPLWACIRPQLGSCNGGGPDFYSTPGSGRNSKTYMLSSLPTQWLCGCAAKSRAFLELLQRSTTAFRCTRGSTQSQTQDGGDGSFFKMVCLRALDTPTQEGSRYSATTRAKSQASYHSVFSS